MTSIKKLALALCLAICFSSVSNAQQVDSTGNLINNNSWSGATYGYDPNDCCSNPGGSQPLYEINQNIIKWSYGQATVSQSIGIQNALSEAGTGLQVHGYNWSWWIRNDNGGTWQGGVDRLNYWVNTTNSSGQLVDQMAGTYDTYFGPTTFSGTRTYTSPYNSSDLGSLTVSFSGRDFGFWAGLYGPEVGSVNISLNYSFDPCASDPLYSSSCPGYLEAYMAQLTELLGYASASEPEAESIDYSLPTSASLSVIPEETPAGEVKVDAGGVEVSTTGELAVPDGIPEVVKEDKKEKKSIDPNLLSNILKEATDDSKALSIVNQSIQDSMSEDANPDFSMTNETLQAIQQQTERSQQQAMQAQESLLQEQSESSVASAQSLITDQSQLQDIEVQTMQFDNTQSTQATEERREDASSEADAVAVIQNSLPSVTEELKQSREASVNQKAEPNEAAGGTDISDIAVSPAGFNDYLTKSLVDSEFYQDKEIYTGQVVVDNRRAQRLLSGASDRLHQEMVDQQYRR